MITVPPVGTVLIPVTANQDFCIRRSVADAKIRVRKHGEVFPPRERDGKSTFKTTRYLHNFWLWLIRVDLHPGWVHFYADQDYVKKSYFFSPLRLRQPQGPPTVPIVHGVGRGCRGHQPAVRVDVYRPFSPHAAVANKLLWCLLPGCFDST